MRIVEPACEAVAEIGLAARERRKAELACRARRRVDARHRHTDIPQALANLARRNVIGKLAFDGFKAGPRCGVDPLEERRFAEEHRYVGAEAQVTIHDGQV